MGPKVKYLTSAACLLRAQQRTYIRHRDNVGVVPKATSCVLAAECHTVHGRVLARIEAATVRESVDGCPVKTGCGPLPAVMHWPMLATTRGRLKIGHWA